MGVTVGIGPLAIGTTAVALVLLAIPTWWGAVLLRSADLSSSERTGRWLLLGVAFVSVVGVIPASLINVAWILMPALIVLLAVDYAVVHYLLARHLARGERRESLGVFLAFVVPPTLLSALTLATALSQLSDAVGSADQAMRGMGDLAFLSFALLGALPTALASIAVTRRFMWQRRTVPVPQETPR